MEIKMMGIELSEGAWKKKWEGKLREIQKEKLKLQEMDTHLKKREEAL